MQFEQNWQFEIHKTRKFSVHFQEVFLYSLSRIENKSFSKVLDEKKQEAKEIKARSSFKSHCCSIADLNSEKQRQKTSQNAKQNNISFALLFTFLFKYSESVESKNQ